MTNEKQYDQLLRLLLIGDSGVGKTQILTRYSDNTIITAYVATIGVDFRIKTVKLQGKRIKLQIWDTSGQERFYTITSSDYSFADGVMLVYDITNQMSFDNISKWSHRIDREAPNAEKLLVGNACVLDPRRVISRERGQQLASSLGISMRETNTKCPDITSIDEAFDTLCRAILMKTQHLPNEGCPEEKAEQGSASGGRCDIM